jgi:hypothetical protein
MDHTSTPDMTRWQRIRQVLAFTRLSGSLLSFVALTMMAVIMLEWHLFYDYHSRVGADWLLITLFAIMLFFLTMGVSLKKDIPIMIIALIGGLIIESWGTQTELWVYFTELPPHNNPSRPPWWIIPAWPISSLAINRIYFLFDATLIKPRKYLFHVLYWAFTITFAFIFIQFTKHTWHLYWTKIFTAFMVFMILFPKTDHRKDFLILVAGTSLGYFLELWGTSRHCWIYYTEEIPPLMAAPAHGIASLGFARGTRFLDHVWTKIRPNKTTPQPDL